MSKRNINESESAKLHLLADLYSRGIEISDSDIQKLQAAGFIKVKYEDVAEQVDPKTSLKLIEDFMSVAAVFSNQEVMANSMIDISGPIPDGILTGDVTVLTPRYYDSILSKYPVYSGKKNGVTKSDWMPKSLVSHTQDFVRWIDSINSPDGFSKMAQYNKFQLYCQQSEDWLSEPTPDITDDSDRFDYFVREVKRCRENSLYALDRHLHIKEASAFGIKKYKGQLGHKVILYLLDCGYGMDIAKARQVAFTTTICGWAMFKAALNADQIIKYISENKDKAEKTFEDKIKYPLGKIPVEMRPFAKNSRITTLIFAEEEEKAVIEGNNSEISVLAPSKTAIASTTPTVTLIDEAGNIDVLNDLIDDIIPTMFGFSPMTGRQELLRQLVMWGTGGYMDKQGIAFYSRYMSDLDNWKKSKPGMLPLFFNVWWRPGMTRELYDQLKDEAYSHVGPDAESRRTRFHQSYPITISDVFLSSGQTLVSGEYIQKSLDRIMTAYKKVPPQYGYFDPIYDTTQPAHEGSDVPFKIIGANFIPTSMSDPRATTIVFDHPKRWINRYYQGTDPIHTDNGHSKMSSTIWDSYYMAPVAVVNFRSQDYRYVFLQCMLLGIYYDVEAKGAVPEVIESNIGTAYREYKQNKGLGSSMVFSTELPMALQTRNGTVIVGVDNKGLRNKLLVSMMGELFTAFGDRIWIDLYYEQLKTFVCKMVGRSETWEPQDKKYNWDDALWSLIYSYICASVYTNRTIKEISSSGSEKIIVKKVLARDKDGKLYYHTQREKRVVSRDNGFIRDQRQDKIAGAALSGAGQDV